ncbi:MAG: ribosome maturation factor RimP [Acidobacteriota bacterium]
MPTFLFYGDMEIVERVEKLIEGVLEAEGFELVHVEYVGAGSAPVLRILLDKPGGITLADCQKMSRHVGTLLDVEDCIGHRYTLEVSSPGIERPLFKEADYARFVGAEIRLTAIEKINERRNFTGFLRGCADRIVEIQCQDSTYSIPLDKVKKANLVYRFE